MKSAQGFKKILLNAVITLAFPVIMYLIMELVVFSLRGTHIINTILDVRNLIRSSGITAATSFALSLNLTSGRMDLSLGAQRMMGTILGGLLALRLGLGGIWVLIFAIVFGIISGALVGLAFVTLRIPPMVLGIGMACIYECVGFFFSGGSGLQLAGTPGVSFLADSNVTIAVMAIVAVFIFILTTFTKFNYELQAIRGSQKIARDSGINVFRNVFLCYTLAGGIVVIGGVFETAFAGSMSAGMGLSSSGTVMACMFAMQLGMFLSRWSNQAIGTIVASLTLKIFTIALTALKISSALSSSIEMILFLVFLVWLANGETIALYQARKARIALAQKTRQERQAAAI